MTLDEQKPIFVVQRTWQAMHMVTIGGNGEVYIARHAQDNRIAALKSEHPSWNSLEYENIIFDALDEAGNPEGFPRRLFYGIHLALKPRRVLVMDLLGGSFLQAMGPDEHQPLSVGTTIRFGMQALRRLQTLHELGFLHRDIKPDNFCVGREGTGQERTVFLIDFGNIQSFIVKKNGRQCHISFDEEALNQTVVFGSEMATRGYTAGRKDDLESLMYVMVYMATGHLPWEQYNDFDNQDHIQKACRMKTSKSTQRYLFKGLPGQIEEAYQYIRSVGFSEEPRYDHIYNLFDTALRQINGHQQDLGVQIPLD